MPLPLEPNWEAIVEDLTAITEQLKQVERDLIDMDIDDNTLAAIRTKISGVHLSEEDTDYRLAIFTAKTNMEGLCHHIIKALCSHCKKLRVHDDFVQLHSDFQEYHNIYLPSYLDKYRFCQCED